MVAFLLLTMPLSMPIFFGWSLTEWGWSYHRCLSFARCNWWHSLGRKRLSADLEGCCATLGIANDMPHRAISDARATTELFCLITNRMFPKGTVNLKKLECKGRIPWHVDGGRLVRSGRTWRREQAEAESSGPCRQLSKLVYRLAGMIHLDNVEHDVAGYLNVLDHVLEDRVVTTEEAESLFECGRDVGAKTRRSCRGSSFVFAAPSGSGTRRWRTLGDRTLRSPVGQ